jgi:alkylation response protein AidB-like acyl-CoA dehydrogenase
MSDLSDLSELHDELRAVARDLLGAGTGWSRLADAGWLGLEVPESLDGAGATFAEVAVVLEELGRAAAPTSYLGSVVLGVPALAGHEMVRAVAAGEAKVAVAVSARGDDAEVRTAFRVERGRVSGRATFVVDAVEADRLLLVAGDVVVLVDPAALAVTAEPVLDATRSFATVVADGAVIEGSWPVDGQALLDRAAVAVAGDSLGLGHAMLDATVAYVKVRQQFGQPIGAFQAVKHQCADMLVQLTIGRELLALAVDAVTAGAPDAGTAAARAKSYLGQAAVDVVGTAMQLHGGIGYTWESGVHVHLKRATLNRSLFGSPAAHRRRLASAF